MGRWVGSLRPAVYTNCLRYTGLMQPVAEAAGRLRANLETAVVLRPQVADLLAAVLFAGGHILLVDVPGVGKTLLARTLARSIQGTFRRVQFTSDLLPADITGTAMYNQKAGDFQFVPGPLFANIVLADEINRATPRTQAALLEAMGEGQVSADGATHCLPRPFLVVATQNPVETYGTFPLPEAELDRFLISLSLGYPDAQQAVRILDLQEHEEPQVRPVFHAEEVEALQRAVRSVAVAVPVKEYVVALIESTRTHPGVILGGSPRAAVALQRASQAWAAIRGRAFVSPDDVKAVAGPVLAHRLVLSHATRTEAAAALVDELLHQVPVPL